jgi:hypothetical protein
VGTGGEDIVVKTDVKIGVNGALSDFFSLADNGGIPGFINGLGLQCSQVFFFEILKFTMAQATGSCKAIQKIPCDQCQHDNQTGVDPTACSSNNEQLQGNSNDIVRSMPSRQSNNIFD